jgi:hypothetical protein
MDPITPVSIPLPPVLDPILSFLSSNLPPPLYQIIFNSLSHSVALFSSLLTLLISLISTKPWEWDSQTLLPPVIMFITAWIALVSLWRTTSWMFRVGTWFAKWGLVVGGVIALLGWMVGNSTAGTRVVGNFGSAMFDFVNGPGRATGPSRTRARPKKRPRPWDSFEAHREWQYSENQREGGDVNAAQKILGDIVGKVREGPWWEGVLGSDRSVGKTAKAKAKGRTSNVR